MMNSTFKTVALSLGLLGGASYAQTASVQIIHNSADAAAEVVDIYAGTSLLIDDFTFRTATEFLDLPSGVSIDIGVAPGDSDDSDDIIATVPVTFDDGETYVVVANGLISPTGYTPGAATAPFNLFAMDMGREEASASGNTDVLVFHGATDAPMVDVQAVGAGTIVDDLDYSDFDADYLELPTADYTLNVTDASGATVVRSFQAPLATLELDDAALVVVASGFLNPAANSDGPAFGLWAALPSGGDLVELPQSEASLQIIHNSADAAAEEVDIYLNGDLLLDDFAFRTSTAFVPVMAEVDNEIAVAPGTSSSAADAIAVIPATFMANETYVAIANGIVSGSGYSPTQPFSLDVFDMGREEASAAGNTDVLVFHGSTDAPTVDIDAAGAGNLIDDISYGEYDADYLELATANYVIEVKDMGGSTTLFSYYAPLAGLSLDDQAIVVVASGFVDPTMNSDGEAFGLWVSLAAGGDMVELPVGFASIDETSTDDLVAFPNPTEGNFTVQGIENGSRLILTSIAGQVVYDELVNNQEEINTESFENGMYVARVIGSNSEKTVKVIIK